MKKILSTLTGFIFLLSACNSSGTKNQDAGYILKGSIKGIDSGTVKLVSHNEDDRTSKTIDSASVRNGTFELKGQAPAQLVTLMVEPGNWSTQIFIEDTVIKVTVDTTGAQHYDYTMYGGDQGAQLKNVTEIGSKNYDAWMVYQNVQEFKKYDPFFNSLSEKVRVTKDIDQQYKFRDQIDSLSKIVNSMKEDYIKNYISKNPTSVAGAYMLRDLYNWYSDLPFDDMRNMVASFTGEAKDSKYYKSLKDILAKRKAVMPGSVAPDFTLMKRDSSKFTLSSSRGKYVMIDFWASWCHPCRKAIPHWKEVYNKYHNKGFDIVSVSDDSRWKDWFKAMDQEKMPWTQVCDEFPVKNMPARVGSLYMTTYIPFYVLMDEDGKILVYSGDEHKIDDKLKEIFGS